MQEDPEEINNDEIHEENMDREQLIEFLGDFMGGSKNIEEVYRSHLCATIVERVYAEFGQEGLAELMMRSDDRGDWISDILIEGTDLENVLYAKHGAFDPDLAVKARGTEALHELNKKIWRLRKKYSRLIVAEIYEKENPEIAA